MGSPPATPAPATRTPAVDARKNVFFERYTDSPEFTHIDNPVVYMEDEVLPEERDSIRDRLRRHPLSQVQNATDLARARSQSCFRARLSNTADERPNLP